ncbi:hypothetical protein H257_01854 [Aphanomyces astaci]|uniref:Uncharacterized protein n=1 Tax=Aphanomyces astaci TaxID=112090 RepID=W4H590_APHAT|nr:hypothetical protein H257_01854 [Aphanomyces astaci]ETV86771.1 hypothetical protein H257_01854 [Aphanomyces astaci]|eukprot:XP_009823570.1 hypothetical protein H257_01854 [Aphanomyces astaci]
MRIAAVKLAASLNFSEGDFVDFKKPTALKGRGVLKLDRAALKINHVGHASGTVPHDMNASPSANGPTLTDASGIYSIDETTGFNKVIYILSLVLQSPSFSKGATKARKKSANQDTMTASK